MPADRDHCAPASVVEVAHAFHASLTEPHRPARSARQRSATTAPAQVQMLVVVPSLPYRVVAGQIAPATLGRGISLLRLGAEELLARVADAEQAAIQTHDDSLSGGTTGAGRVRVWPKAVPQGLTPGRLVAAVRPHPPNSERHLGRPTQVAGLSRCRATLDARNERYTPALTRHSHRRVCVEPGLPRFLDSSSGAELHFFAQGTRVALDG